MADEAPPHRPSQTGLKPPARPDRLAREAAALRANLHKRKQQARAQASIKTTAPHDDDR